MSRMLVVLSREYVEVVRRRSFLIGTIAAPLLLSALMTLPALLAVRGLGGRRVAVVDGTGRLAAAFTGAPGLAGELPGALGREGRRLEDALGVDVAYIAAADPDAAAEPLLAQIGSRGPTRFDGVLVVPADACSNPAAALTYYARSAADFITQERLAMLANQAIARQRLAARGIDAADASALLRRVRVEPVAVAASGERRRGGELDILVGFVFVLLLGMPMLIYGQEVMRGIVQEKGDRVVEILVSSVSPLELLAGKVLGLAAVGLTQLAVWAAMGGAGIALLGGVAAGAGVDVLRLVSLSLLPFFLLFYLLGYLIFVCVYAIGGAISTTEKEAQQALAPIVSLTMVPWLLAVPILASPDSGLATALSLVPLFTPITMFLRMVVSSPPAWQVATSVALSVATIAGMFWVAAKIFRVAILASGSRPSVATLWRWVRAG